MEQIFCGGSRWGEIESEGGYTDVFYELGDNVKATNPAPLGKREHKIGFGPLWWQHRV